MPKRTQSELLAQVPSHILGRNPYSTQLDIIQRNMMFQYNGHCRGGVDISCNNLPFKHNVVFTIFVIYLTHYSNVCHTKLHNTIKKTVEEGVYISFLFQRKLEWLGDIYVRSPQCSPNLSQIKEDLKSVCFDHSLFQIKLNKRRNLIC